MTKDQFILPQDVYETPYSHVFSGAVLAKVAGIKDELVRLWRSRLHYGFETFGQSISPRVWLYSTAEICKIVVALELQRHGTPVQVSFNQISQHSEISNKIDQILEGTETENYYLCQVFLAGIDGSHRCGFQLIDQTSVNNVRASWHLTRGILNNPLQPNPEVDEFAVSYSEIALSALVLHTQRMIMEILKSE